MNRLFIAKEKERLLQCYTKEQIASSFMISNDEFYKNPEKYSDTQFIFSTWGMIPLSEEEIKAYFPKLEAVFYAAGSVKYFATPFFNQNIRIFSAWMANAVPVSEFLVGQILLANKGYFLMHQTYQKQGFTASRQYCRKFEGNYKTKVGFLGFGTITQYTIERLKPYDLDIYVYSNHLLEEDAEKLKIKKVDMDYIFSNCQTISNNMANQKDTENIINLELFSKMREYSTFINTGRGAQVHWEDMKQYFREHPNNVALIDVTDPDEPLSEKDTVWDISNIFISPHSAGSISQEIFRMGDYMINTYENFNARNPVSYEVTIKMLDTMA